MSLVCEVRLRSRAGYPVLFAVLAGALLVASAVAASESDDSGATVPHDHALHADHAVGGPDDAAAHAAHAGHADHPGMHDGDGHADAAGADDPHAHHRAMLSRQDYKRTEHQYRPADRALVAMTGEPTGLSAELAVQKPVLMNFIFTTCSTICPVMSATFAEVQEELGPEAATVRMLSFSIDPEYDTPQRLRAYARQFGAGDQWNFLTGDLDDLIAVQKAFDVYRGNKMNHEPTTLMRRAPGEPWVRLDGIASAADIVAEYRRLVRD